MGILPIKLKVAGKSYAFDIDSSKEEVYRLAEREVNEFLKQAKQEKYEEWKDDDYLALAALQFAIDYTDLRQNRELNTEDLKRLHEIDREIDTYLNTPEKE